MGVEVRRVSLPAGAVTKSRQEFVADPDRLLTAGEVGVRLALSPQVWLAEAPVPDDVAGEPRWRLSSVRAFVLARRARS